MQKKKRVKITSHGILRVAKFKGLRTPAELYLTPLEIEVLKSQGVELHEIDEPPVKLKQQTKPKKKGE